MFSNAVQAGQARLEQSLQQDNAAFKRGKLDNKQTDSKATETIEAVLTGQHVKVAAMPPLAPPGLEHLASDLLAKAAANL